MTESPNTVLYEVRDGIAHIGLNRPERLNALTPELLGRLHEAVEAAPGDGARAILLYGAGRSFCAGADLTSAGNNDAGEKLRDHYHPVARAMHRSSIPIVSAVQGVAAGGGAGLALSADIVVMERSATLAFVFAKLGLVPDVGATWFLARSIGRARTLELALLGEELTAEAAYASGVITQITETGQGYARAAMLAEELATMPTVALGLIRTQVSDALRFDFDESLETEATNQSRASATEDFKEAVRAFREKRRPAFIGR